jgi:hypothetical protein
MSRAGISVHISGTETETCHQVAILLAEMLGRQGYPAVVLAEETARQALLSADEALLARAIGWATQLTRAAGGVVLVAVGPAVGAHLISLPDYSPGLELAVEGPFVTRAARRLAISADPAQLPQEVARAVLVLEEQLPSGAQAEAEFTADNVYTAEEEAYLQEHLRSLGYL